MSAGVTLEQARALAARGLNLLPLHANAKTPDASVLPDGSWKHLQRVRSTDADLERWFGNGAQRNAGIVLGVTSGVCVIDTDTEAAEAWAREQENAGRFPRTLMQTRTAKGMHRYYQLPPGVTLPAFIHDQGLTVEIKRDGHFVVAPGSVHPDGSVYEAIGDWPASIEDLPLLPSAVLRPSEPTSKPKAAPIPDVIAAGGRNNTLASIAGRLRRIGLKEPEILATLGASNQGRCHPPVEDRELETIARSVARYDAGPTVYHETDTGNAEAFAATAADRVRYDYARKEWRIFDGHHWRSDAGGDVDRLLQQHLLLRHVGAAELSDDTVRKATIKWLLQSESESKRAACLSLTRSQPAIADSGNGWDADPWLIGVQNGIIDLRTGQLRAGQPADRITYVAPVAFEPGATCARFDQFLEEIFAGDPELPGYLQRVIGYALTGDTAEQAFWILYGTGANGKSTLIETLSAILGPYVWGIPFPSAQWSDAMSEYQKASLVGRRFVTSSEVTRRGQLNEELIKSLTGGDTLNARHPYGRPFNFQPVAKFFLRVNDKPIIRDDSHGMWRRVKLIPFTQRFAPNPSLAAELREEAAGILAWAVRGCLEWQRNGLREPATVRAATNEYRQEQDALTAFLGDCCVITPQAHVAAGELYRRYEQWCEREHVPDGHRLSHVAFGRKCQDRFESRKTRQGRNYCGVGIRQPQREDLF